MYAHVLVYIDIEACTKTVILACFCVNDAPTFCAAGRRATLRLGRVDRRVTPDARLAETSETAAIMKGGYEAKPHESLTQLQCSMRQHDVTAEPAEY